ncbi:MAG TPA: hypothetical protein VHR72_10960 [Gemmataceae bacterium]|nr:hypothetical protein [Gemmataceae bacterium]
MAIWISFAIVVAASGTGVLWLLNRTWFDPAWLAARHERLFNDPLYEENWEKWA